MINKSTLLGRLARDPELKTFSDGNCITNIRVITTRSWRDKTTQEMKEQIEGHNVSIRVSVVAKSMADKLKKGDLVYIEGGLETRKWTDAQSVTRYVTEIVVRPYGGTVKKLPLSMSRGLSQTGNEPSQTSTSQTEETQDASENTEKSDENSVYDFFADTDNDSNDFLDF
jgi:single-strand DNA-binding protein